MVLVVGATGLLGSAVCQKLVERGERVRALVRESSSQEKVNALKSSGAELVYGDLKDFGSIEAACRGVDAVISTASSTLSRQPGDSIESVDGVGQVNLVKTIKNAGIDRFVFVSFQRPSGISSPLAEAKKQVEDAISELNYTVVQASWFMEVWLSPALGFDYVNGTARIYGTGKNPISWVSFRDVAEMCVVGLHHPAASRRAIQFGGPEALSPLDVVTRFEQISGRPFTLDHVPESALHAQFDTATDPMQKSFAALMLGYARGDVMDMTWVLDTFAVKLTSVNDYAHSVLAKAANT